MGLYNRIEEDIKSALKAGDGIRLSVLRMVLSAVKMQEIEKKIKRAQEDDVIQVIQRDIKQHRDSIDQFEKGNRKDLADKEREELKILESYMPEQMSEAELEKIVKEAIDSVGAKTKSDTGKAMKAVMEKAKGRAEGRLINQLVMKILK